MGSTAAPFDFSVDPSKAGTGKGEDCIASSSNFNFYQQIGNVGLIGFTGAESYVNLEPFFEEACSTLSNEPTVKVVMLLSHWDKDGDGADADTSTIGAFAKVKSIAGCDTFFNKGMFKWVTGHTHCSNIEPYGDVNGFRGASRTLLYLGHSLSRNTHEFDSRMCMHLERRCVSQAHV